MPKHTVTLTAVAMLLAACNSSAPTDPSARSMPGPSFAADHTTPGTPGDPNCRGQSAAFLAQASKNGLADDAFRGIGGIARFTDLTVQEVNAAIDAFCTGV